MSGNEILNIIIMAHHILFDHGGSERLLWVFFFDS